VTPPPRPTLTPSFRDTLPTWTAGRPWYRGTGTPRLALLGTLRFEDPAGEVGMETHLVHDGSTAYQLPLTYRGAPLEGAEDALVTRAEHSELGSRWIYDAEHDPVWNRLVVELALGRGAEPVGWQAGAHGQRISSEEPPAGELRVEVARVLVGGPVPTGAADVWALMGAWRVGGTEVGGPLVVVRRGGREPGSG